MIINNKIARLLLIVAPVAGILSCQKMKRPALGNFDKDYVTTPSTALRFYANFDSTEAADKQINIRFKDSISKYPSFFPKSSITVGTGIHGTALNGTSGAAVQYINANDFSASTSFTVAFWEKNTVPTGGKAQFAFTLPDKDYWASAAMFILFDHTGSGATTDSAVVKFYINDNSGDHWFELVNTDRVSGIYDNNWHHLAFSYDEATSNMKVYKDGSLYRTLSWAGHGAIHLTPSSVFNLVVGGMNKHVSLPGPTDDWMESWKGGIDQFRLYNKALNASEVQSLFTNRQ